MSMRCLAVMMLVAVCAHGKTQGSASGVPWMENPDLKAQTLEGYMQPVKRYNLNLDVDAQHRWDHIAADFKDEAYKITDYLKSQLPTWAYPIAVRIAAQVEPYFTDYGDEMIGLANALDLDLGEVVAVNLIYQLERIGVNCSNWNNTGPTLDDDAIPRGLSCADAEALYEAKRAKDLETGPAGYCTSIVSMDAQGAVTHGRNMDWNLPDSLKDLVIDVDVYSNGTLLYTGTTAVSFVGILNGVHHGATSDLSWSVSLDARNHGGRIPVNFAEALRYHAMTPEQAIRKVLESGLGSTGYEDAITALSDMQLVNDAYFVMAGPGETDGAVVTRARNHAVDVWRINSTDPSGWWRVETNYDHWNAVPKADDRRDPANALMEGLGSPAGVEEASMLGVLSTWPVLNAHTTFTSIMDPSTGYMNTSVWMNLS